MACCVASAARSGLWNTTQLLQFATDRRIRLISASCVLARLTARCATLFSRDRLMLLRLGAKDADMCLLLLAVTGSMGVTSARNPCTASSRTHRALCASYVQRVETCQLLAGTYRKTCEKCNRQKGVREFRVAQGKPSNECRACERILCAHCGEQKNTSDFNARSVENFFSHSQNVVCVVCAASGATPTSGSYKAEKADGDAH